MSGFIYMKTEISKHLVRQAQQLVDLGDELSASPATTGREVDNETATQAYVAMVEHWKGACRVLVPNHSQPWTAVFKIANDASGQYESGPDYSKIIPQIDHYVRVLQALYGPKAG